MGPTRPIHKLYPPALQWKMEMEGKEKKDNNRTTTKSLGDVICNQISEKEEKGMVDTSESEFSCYWGEETAQKHAPFFSSLESQVSLVVSCGDVGMHRVKYSASNVCGVEAMFHGRIEAEKEPRRKGLLFLLHFPPAL